MCIRDRNKKSYIYIGLPILGILFYLAYLKRSAIDMVYSDYIRLINSYLPDVWNPDKFFVADLLTRIPVNFLERGLNVMIFGYSVTVDRVMGVLGFGLSALVIGWYSRKKELCPVWYAAMMIVMFSLNKWEMLYNLSLIHIFQELHLPIYHALCLMLEDRFYAE